MSSIVEQIIFVLGFTALFIILLGAGCAIVLAIICLLLRFTPRLHIGAPTNDGELCFYDYRSVTTGKDGEHVTGQRRMINAPLGIRWWFGMSQRSAPKWFIGIIRWEPKQ